MDLVTESSDKARLAELRATIEFETGSSSAAARLALEGAIGIAQEYPDQVIPMLCTAVHHANYAGDGDVADRIARQLAGVAVPADQAMFFPAITGVAQLTAGELTAGLRELRRGLRPLAASADRLTPAMSLATAAFAVLAGDDQSAFDVAAALVMRCRAHGMISTLPFALTYQCVAQQFRGEMADAHVAGAEAMRMATDTGQSHRIGHLNGVLARIAAIEGDESSCASFASHGPFGDSKPSTSWAETSLSLLDLGFGRHDAVLSRLTKLLSGPAGKALMVTFSMPDLVEAAVGTHREEVAVTALARFEDFSRAAGQPWAEAVTLRCHAMLGHDPGDNFGRAVRLHSVGGRPFEQARTELAYGRWLRRVRRRLDARAQLESALATLTGLGATPWAEQARTELRAAGATAVRQAGVAGPAARLTTQELQVARRAAAGLSNRQIAAELFLSPRTVGYHLYKVYPKLNVTSRAQLASLVLSDDLAVRQRTGTHAGRVARVHSSVCGCLAVAHGNERDQRRDDRGEHQVDDRGDAGGTGVIAGAEDGEEHRSDDGDPGRARELLGGGEHPGADSRLPRVHLGEGRAVQLRKDEAVSRADRAGRDDD